MNNRTGRRINVLASTGLILSLLIPRALCSQIMDRDAAGAFVRALIRNDDSLTPWLDRNDLAISHRLGITYDGVRQKSLIAYDLDDSTRKMLQGDRLPYFFTVDTLSGLNTRVNLTIGNGALEKEYYFRERVAISPIGYHSGGWKRLESEHFRFFLSDTTRFNAYCRDQLEAFLGRMADLLGLNEHDMETLSGQKIFYYLCGDEDEIERMTGFRARGMFNLAYDAVITTYNAHYHELLHLLINYKLRHLPLFTHPFLQEGFAVAFGGRGGLEPEAILPAGRFLFESGFVGLSVLLRNDGFRQTDPSLTYPCAGLYNRFLVATMGMESYLQMYRRHSGEAGSHGVLHIEQDEVPEDSLWASYLRGPASRNAIRPDSIPDRARVIFEDSTLTIADDGDDFIVMVRDAVAHGGAERYAGYSSMKFREELPGRSWSGEKYLIRASAAEISVYNLFTNNLIASYVAAFSLPPVSVPMIGGTNSFRISKTIVPDLAGATR
jgi:hypothetical protein